LGLIPQALACLAAWTDPDLKWIALASGFGYAALIFSFLGGLWWGIALTCLNAPRWLFGAAVAPSLIGLGLYLPWTFGWNWPRPSLIILALCIAGSCQVDRNAVAFSNLTVGWMDLRKRLSLGLATLTVLLALA
jgi:hypothetical protein